MPGRIREPARSVRLDLSLVTHGLRFVPARMLHVGMLIVCIMAFSGPGAEDDSGYIVVQPGIKFPAIGNSVQQAEIALTVLCLVVDPILSILLMCWGSRVAEHSPKARPSRVKRMILFIMGPWNILLLAGWLVCIVYQSSYVPILGGKKLALCNSARHKVTQCGMVDASWIMSMFFCADHALLIFLSILALVALPSSPKGGTLVMNSATPARNETQPIGQTSTSRPPSYRSKASASQNTVIPHMMTHKNG